MKCIYNLNDLRAAAFKLSLITVVMAVLIGAMANASEDLEQGEEDCSTEDCVTIGQWQFSLSLGLGLRTNPLYDSDPLPLVIIPHIRYYGERFFLENLDIGWTLLETPKTMVNALLTPSYDGVFFNRWDPGNVFVDIATVDGVAIGEDSSLSEGDSAEADASGEVDTAVNPDELRKRRFSYLGGLEYSHFTKQGIIQAVILTEVTNRHSGNEIRFAYQRALSQDVTATLGITWKDENLTQYYYGVEEGNRYQPSSSLNTFFRLSLAPARLEKRWRLGFEWQQLDSEIASSPIVEKDYVATFFVGKRFDF